MSYTAKVIADLKARYADQPEFLQAAVEVLETIEPAVEAHPEFEEQSLLERLVEPERVIMFRVPWVDDEGKIQVNRGYRVEFNSAIGPYKGGLRFNPTVTLGMLKFLGFEQIFKNALTSLPMGGGKGGSDFSARGRSDAEILRFCRSFMTELYKYIGPDTDVPAGDIGVGAREIGFLYGQYKRIVGENTGVLTGKTLGWGGSLVRPEATGFGTMYFADEMLRQAGDTLEGKRIAVSGFGNVAWGAVLKAAELGAKVVTISGPDGYILDEEGVSTPEKAAFMLQLRASNNDVVKPYADKFHCQFVPGRKPWEVPVDMAFPCAIQNELDLEDARTLVSNGCRYVVETSNMGVTAQAMDYLLEKEIPLAPGKAANAGGVAVSGLEMSQNAQHLYWTRQEVDSRLRHIMSQIHSACVKDGRQDDGYINYVKGANIAGFRKVADAMCQQGY